MVECTSRAMQRVYHTVSKVAPTDLNVLLTGESGVGKEMVARSIYQQSNRAEQPFVKVNSAALPHSLIESELFGYHRGAFTGAEDRRFGKVDRADQGTLFFDEIAELDTRSQIKLLQVIQEREFTPLGTNTISRVDIRILAATNRDLRRAVGNGSFRRDLFHRLKVVEIRIPSLRERKRDIPILFDHFLECFSREFDGSHYPPLDRKWYRMLVEYQWPGNVRELENFVKNLVVLRDPAASFKKLAGKIHTTREPDPSDDNPSLAEVARQTTAQLEKLVISRVLEESGWNRKVASRRLRISYRSLLDKIKKLEIE